VPPLQRPAEFTVREYQLVLLRRMADFQPERVERARAELGCTVTEMREVNAHWQRMIRSAGSRGASPLRSVLGTPETDESLPMVDLTCRITRWRLPLWPDLRYQLLAAPGGAPVAEMLVRAPESAPPKLERISDLTPWSCVVGDVERAFRPVRHRDGSAPTRWTVDFAAPGDDGRPVAATAEFVHGLLQVVHVGERL
jgi:hypothetical protein